MAGVSLTRNLGMIFMIRLPAKAGVEFAENSGEPGVRNTIMGQSFIPSQRFGSCAIEARDIDAKDKNPFDEFNSPTR